MRGTFFGCPQNKDCSILGYRLGNPHFMEAAESGAHHQMSYSLIS